MKKEDNDNDASVILAVTDLVLTFVKRVGDLLHMAVLEAQLAAKTLVVIVALLFILGIVLTASWMSLLALLFFYLLSIHWSTLAACSAVVVINLLALAGITYIIYKLKDNLYFRNTRSQLNPSTFTEDPGYEKAATKN